MQNMVESHRHYVKKADIKNCLGMIALYEVKEQAKYTTVMKMRTVVTFGEIQ